MPTELRVRKTGIAGFVIENEKGEIALEMTFAETGPEAVELYARVRAV